MYPLPTVLVLMVAAGATAFATSSPIPPSPATSPLPQNYGTLDYIYDFSYPYQNLICPSGVDGCGGGFQAYVSDNPTGPGTAATLTTVWCVDYQLDVTSDSNYTAEVTNLASVSLPTDINVRYGNLTETAPPNAIGWANGVTDPTGIDNNQANSAAYRYTLAAALVSQYLGPGTNSSTVPNPTNLDGYSSGDSAANSINTAIQEAIWYVTYNNDYQPGASWPPYSLTTTNASCGSGGSAAPTGDAAGNPLCWVQYAEANANSVNTANWDVVSGPANAAGLLDPQIVEGYASYQTFLVQVSPAPEPAYYVLVGISCLGLFVVSRHRRAKAKA